MHKKENMGLVELATVSFGQSFQITPIQLVTTASSIINGGNRITPHFAIKAESRDGSLVREFTYPVRENVVSEETSRDHAAISWSRWWLRAAGNGQRWRASGSEEKRPPRKSFPGAWKKYISSFLGFAPADDPQVIALITIDEPVGIYYGGTIAALVIADIFENILPYLGLLPGNET